MMGARARREGSLVAALLLAACAKIDGGPGQWTYDGPVNACGAGVACAAGTCDPELGACVVSPPPEEALLARVVPDPATGAPAQVYPVSVLGGEIGNPLAVRVPVTVTGETVAGDVDDGDVSSEFLGHIVFSDVGNRLPGHPAQITVYESYASSVFDLALLPSTYDIIAVPEGDQASSFPIRYLDGVVLDTTGVFLDEHGDPMGVVLPRAAATVEGRITQADVPMGGFEIVAFDPETSRIVSTVDETSCEDLETCGAFSIGLAKSTVEAGTPFSLSVSRLNEAQHPVLEIHDLETPEAGEVLEDLGVEIGALGVPIRFQAKVLQPTKTQTGVTVYDTAPSCFVAFSSADVAGGKVEKWVLTNESGELEETPGVTGVILYPGGYSITVIPAYASVGSTSDYAVYTSTEPVAVFENDSPLELLLSFRPTVTGAVAAGGLPVPTSAISAEPAAGASITARSNSAMSGSSGKFRFWLDAAPYVVVAEAPAESRFAWDLVEVTVPEETLSISFDLPLPFALRGVVAASSDQVNPIDVGGSVVEWYREIGGRAYAVGRTVADADGAFAALLPP
ncbi:MAG: hypothetical protein M0R80_05400 [Proteobacteria bacterium]|nr:hypothetical protein [Pseudomonadota bacterium]